MAKWRKTELENQIIYLQSSTTLSNPSSCKGKNMEALLSAKNAILTDSKKVPTVIYFNSI